MDVFNSLAFVSVCVSQVSLIEKGIMKAAEQANFQKHKMKLKLLEKA
jgi:hypothetical protein